MKIKQALDDIISPLLHKRGPYFIKILKYWSKMFKKEFSEHILPTSMSLDGVLCVKSDSKGSVILTFQSQLMIETINMFFGKRIVKEIKSSPWIRPIPMNKSNLKSFHSSEECLNQIQDHSLREALKGFTELL
jgi:hypothetical protein